MSGQGDSTYYWLTTNDTDYLGSAGDGDPTLLMLDSAARTKDLADRFAKGMLATTTRAASEIEVTVFGRPSVDLGQDISVSGVPDDAGNGKGYVRMVRHRFGPRTGFVSSLRIALEASA
jgi:hypothetical protein